MPDTASLALKIDRLMRRIHAELHPQAQTFDDHKVGPIGGMLLLTIGESEPVDMKTIVRALGRDKSQVSRLVQTLDRKGLITKTQSAQDGRAATLSLTPDGQAQLTRIQDALTDVIEELFEPVTQEQSALFADLLDQILRTKHD
ncbi:MAG: MarR family transcriptional regulator [Pseudomonadota bacterium]